MITMIWFPLLLDSSLFGNPPLYLMCFIPSSLMAGGKRKGRGAHYECINTWMIFEWTCDLLLVISSWAWLCSIKADRTTQLHFYGTADGFTTTANLKVHTLNSWQTCYLNWKFNTFCILDIDIKLFLKWNSFLLYRTETIWCTFVLCTIRAPNMLLRGRHYLCTKVFL